MSVSLWWVGGTSCEWECLHRCRKCLMGNKKQLCFNDDFFPLGVFTQQPTLPPQTPPTPPSPVLTLQLRAAVPAAVVLTVGGAVHHLRDADQELAVVPEDRHGQFAPALLHQVLGLQQGEILCRHAIDLKGSQSLIGLMKSKSQITVICSCSIRSNVHLQDEVSFMQSPFFGGQARFCHVLDEDLTAQLQSIL